MYSKAELRMMELDMFRLSHLVDGFVIGVLDANANVDSNACQMLMQSHDDHEFTFHRAFDMCNDPFEATQQLIKLNFSRVLTSGQQKSADLGKELIKQLQSKFGDEISFMAGGGINEDNLKAILEESGIKEFHASARTKRKSAMEFRNEKCHMGNEGDDEFSISVTSEERVRKMVQIYQSVVR